MNGILDHCCDSETIFRLAQNVINSIPANNVLLLAATLDYLIGDPWGWPHPVRVMGWIISHYGEFVLKQFSRPITVRLGRHRFGTWTNNW